MAADRTLELSRRGFLAGTAACALSAVDAQAKPAWNDVHLHVIGGRERQFDIAVERAVAEMDRRGIAKAVVFPPPYPRMGGFDYPDYLPPLRRYPNRLGFLGGGGTLNPAIQNHSDPTTVTPPVRQAFVDQANRILDAGAVGFGEMAALHLSLVPNHSFEQVSIVQPLYLALVEVAGERKAVIDLHMDPVIGASMRAPPGLKVPPNPPTLNGNIADFERLLAHHRDARIVWAHGGSDFTGNMSPALIGRLMDRHPNLFMSLRPVPMRISNNPFGLRFYNLMLTPQGVEPAWLALLRKHNDRFVMGGDAFITAPSVNMDGPLSTLSRGNEGRFTAAGILLARLPPPLAHKIGVENAARLYRL